MMFVIFHVTLCYQLNERQTGKYWLWGRTANKACRSNSWLKWLTRPNQTFAWSVVILQLCFDWPGLVQFFAELQQCYNFVLNFYLSIVWTWKWLTVPNANWKHGLISCFICHRSVTIISNCTNHKFVLITTKSWINWQINLPKSHSRQLVNSFCMRARFLKYRDKGFGVRASLISIQSSNSMTVSGGPWWNCMVCSVRWQNQMLEAQTIKAWGEYNLSSSKGWVGESIKELNSGTSEPIMIEKKHRKKSKRKKSESLSDRFLLGVSEFLMMITICGLMIISNDASGLWSEVIAKITEEWGSLVGRDSLPWNRPQACQKSTAGGASLSRLSQLSSFGIDHEEERARARVN